MHYRYHLCVCEKKEIEEERKKLIELDDRNIRFEEIMFKMMREDLDIGEIDLSGIGERFYQEPRTHLVFNHYKPKVLDLDAFKRVIDCVRMEISIKYAQLSESKMMIDEFIKSRLEMWKDRKYAPYHLEDDFMSNDKSAEYMIWDLIRIYKSIDWENESVIIFGY